MARADIVAHLKIPRTTIYDHLKKLVHAEVIAFFTENRRVRGRPKVYFAVVTGVGITGDKIPDLTNPSKWDVKDIFTDVF